MTLTVSVADDQLGAYYRRTAAIADRLGKSLDFDSVMDALQRIHDGKFEGAAPSILPVDRSKPFDPVALLGKGWTIEEQDERALALTGVDLSKVALHAHLRRDESYTTGEERLKRLKNEASERIRLDAAAFLALKNDPSKFPVEWKKKVNGNIQFIFFDGTVLRYPYGYRCSLCAYWNDGKFGWSYYWLDSRRLVSDPSALLAS